MPLSAYLASGRCALCLLELQLDYRRIIENLTLPLFEDRCFPFVVWFPFIGEDREKQNLVVFEEKGQLLEPETVQGVFLRIASHEVLEEPGQVIVF